MLKSIRYFVAMAIAVALQTTSVVAANAEWDRTVLPRPPQPFQGVTNSTLEGSVAAFTPPVQAPPNAPNILLVLIDDAGFGNPSTFGGPVATPTFDKLAAEGLRYNRFHVTALCSPT
ncbi:MAG TPA: sulfatase-like hydrolase/transferase, partial [Candidatus Udaeobacter sp.]|nr:sulfatase-like hydrolase/transferase [Candidatus Udaeobacter sp.]